MVSSTIILCIAQNNRTILEESRATLNNPVPNFYKRKCLFPLENQNVPIFLGFGTKKLGQFQLNRDSW